MTEPNSPQEQKVLEAYRRFLRDNDVPDIGLLGKAWGRAYAEGMREAIRQASLPVALQAIALVLQAETLHETCCHVVQYGVQDWRECKAMECKAAVSAGNANQQLETIIMGPKS